MFEVIEDAFPRLIRALRRAAGLTHMEAVAAIYSHRYGDGCGDACASIRHAISQRGAFRPLRAIQEA